MIARFLIFVVMATFTFIPLSSSYAISPVKLRDNDTLTFSLVEDESLPMVVLSMALPQRGYVHDPKGKEGLAHFVAQILLEGAGEHDHTAFKHLLDKHAITLDYSVDRENFYIHVRTLKQHLPLALELLTTSVRSPALDDARIEHVRQTINFGLLKYQETATYAAKKAWKEAVYRNQPYARMKLGSSASLAAITKEDIQHYLSNMLHTAPAIGGIVGDITRAEANAIIDAHIAPLFAKEAATPEHLTNALYFNGETITITQDRPQSVAYFGFPAVSRHDDDFFALYVLNHIFGGNGLESLLNKALREEEGLTYSAYSTLDTNEHFGIVMGKVSTKGKDILRSLDIVRNVIKDVKSGAITQAQLDDAKSNITGSFPLQFDDSKSMADFLVYIQYHKLGLDYFTTRNDYINKVTLDDIQYVAKKYFDNDNLVVAVVGNL